MGAKERSIRKSYHNKDFVSSAPFNEIDAIVSMLKSYIDFCSIKLMHFSLFSARLPVDFEHSFVSFVVGCFSLFYYLFIRIYVFTHLYAGIIQNINNIFTVLLLGSYSHETKSS